MRVFIGYSQHREQWYLRGEGGEQVRDRYTGNVLHFDSETAAKDYAGRVLDVEVGFPTIQEGQMELF